MSSFNQIKECYFNIYGKSPFLSSFKNCSIDDTTREPLVLNETECFNFDKIKGSLSIQSNSADSLFFSKKEEVAVFVEFKNSPIRNASTNIGCSSADSLHIHSQVLFRDSLNPIGVTNHFLAVLSVEKNHMHHESILNAILNRSSANKVFEFEQDSIETLSKDRFARKYPELANLGIYYTSYVIIDSSVFDNFFTLKYL